MNYDWPHTRAACQRLKTAWAYVLVKWAMRLDPHEVCLVSFEHEIYKAYERKIDAMLTKEPTPTPNADGEK